MSWEEYAGSFDLEGECVEGYWKNCCLDGKWTLCLDTEASTSREGVVVKDPKAKPCGCDHCKGHHTSCQPPVAFSPRIVVEGFSADDLVKILSAMERR
jgi:hypothetical protein